MFPLTHKQLHQYWVMSHLALARLFQVKNAVVGSQQTFCISAVTKSSPSSDRSCLNLHFEIRPFWTEKVEPQISITNLVENSVFPQRSTV